MFKRLITVSIVFSLIVPFFGREAAARRLADKRYPVCGKYQVAGPKRITFNGNEKTLICGDEKIEAWGEIPDNQAEYSIKNFLIDRGYYFPEFVKEGDMVTIYPGKPTKVTKIVLEGEYPDCLKVKRKRRIMNQPMTPKLLSTLETWILSELANEGYPCAKLETEAEAYSGQITIKLDIGKYQCFPEVKLPELKGLEAWSLKRFYAFKVSEPFNNKLLSLTTRRTKDEGIVQDTFFTTNCKGENVELSQSATLGKTRIFIFGVGVSTEEYVKGKISWKHTRLDKKGSSILVRAIASYRRQKGTIAGRWIPLNKPSKWSIAPTLMTERREENKYEYIKGEAGVYSDMAWDGRDLRMELSAGPAFNVTETIRGALPGRTHFMTANLRFNIISHNFEYYDSDPKEGFVLNFLGSFNSDKVGSSISVQMLQLYGEWLWNIANLDEPLLIFGVRGRVATSITDYNSPKFGRLPPDYLLYLGGARDLRGFKRQELPRAYNAALTTAYTSLEFRLANYLPVGIEPVVFVDFGILGRTTFNFDCPVFWSPGFGVRINSIIGVIRMTAARGMLIKNRNPLNNPARHWQFFASYGQEF